MMELMKEAGLNTLLGMGMTFLVLILLSFIISLFGKLINGLQNKSVEKSRASLGKGAGTEVQEISAEEVVEEASVRQAMPAEGDDIMAVIAAAIAAYESESLSPEIAAVIAAAVTAYEGTSKGYVVRKIRKSRRHVA